MASPDIRAWAKWEAEYRVAFDKQDALDAPPVNQRVGTLRERLEQYRQEAIEMSKGQAGA